MKRLLVLVIALSMTLVGAAPSVADAGEVDVVTDCEAGSIDITASKHLSNIVYSIDGVHGRIELEDLDLYSYSLSLEGVTTVWVKSGGNGSGDGPGYGERFDISDCAPQDADGDGFAADVDCNDQDSSINPGAVDIPNNGIDENCDGSDLIVTTGDIRVTLTWDTDDDLDLYVTDPNGDKVWWSNTAVASGGFLDRDDNVAVCGSDPEPGGVENIVWNSPPSGTYTVELSNWSDCVFGESTNYTIEVYMGGALVTSVSGTTDENDGGVAGETIVNSFTFEYPAP